MSAPAAFLIITTSFPIVRDGSEAAGSFVCDLVEELALHLPVRVVAPGDVASTERWSDRITVFRFAAPPQALSSLKPWRLADLLQIRRVLDSGAAATRRALQSGPTAHMLALWALPSGHWARRTSRETGVPYSVWTLGSDIWTLGRLPIVRSFMARVLRDAQTCYSDGRGLAEATRRIGGRAVEFLPSTRRIEPRRIEPRHDAPPYRLLFLGRWHPNKGVDILLDALADLGANDWKRIDTVEVCGGGPLEATVRERVQALRAAGRPVVLRGFLDKSQAEAAILRADYLVIPSRIESIPVVFSDAVKLGCPVIATPVGDLKALIEASPPCGIVAEAASSAALAAVISQALAGSAKSFAAGSQEASKTFDLTSIVDRLLKNAGLSGAFAS